MRGLLFAAVVACVLPIAAAPTASATPVSTPPPYVDHVEWAKWGDLSSLRVYPTAAGRDMSARPGSRPLADEAWSEVLTGGMLDPQGQPKDYFGALLSHRLLRYASGPLHLVLLVTSLRLASKDRGARALLALQAGGIALALAGRRFNRMPLANAAWYYVVVNAASVAGLARVLSRGPDTTWAPDRETR